MKQAYLDHINFFKGLLSQERLQRIESVLNVRTRHLTVVLEDTHKPHNISAVMRNVDGFGIQDIHLIEDSNTSVPLSRYVAKNSDKWLSIHKHKSTSQRTAIEKCLQHLKSKNYQLIALSPHAPNESFESIDLQKKSALLMGKEISGLSQELIDASDHFIKLPMFGFSESFNLSVATALCLQKLSSRIRKSSVPWTLSEEEKNELRNEWILKSIHKIERYEKALGIEVEL